MRTYCLQREPYQKKTNSHSNKGFHSILIFHYKCSGNSDFGLKGSIKPLRVYTLPVCWRAEVHGITRVGHNLATEEQHLTSSLPPKDAHQHRLKEMLNLVFWKCGQVAAHAIMVPIAGSQLPEMETSEKLWLFILLTLPSSRESRL